jgi:hypothetical protein
MRTGVRLDERLDLGARSFGWRHSVSVCSMMNESAWEKAEGPAVNWMNENWIVGIVR